MATRFELATQKWWCRYAFSNCDLFNSSYLSKKRSYSHGFGFIWQLINTTNKPVNMNTVASQLTKLWLIELRTVKVEEGGCGTHKLYGNGAFRAWNLSKFITTKEL